MCEDSNTKMAQALTVRQYDMLAAPITNPHFRERVLDAVSATFTSLGSSHTSDTRSEAAAASAVPTIIVAPLTAADTDLAPTDFSPRLVGTASTWIDPCSPDPVVAGISRQVLHLEVAWAAFCGLSTVIIPGPCLYHGDAAMGGLTAYARAVDQALRLAGASVALAINMPMVDDPAVETPCALADQARPECLDHAEAERPKKVDAFGMWDAWHVVRTTCNYSARLFAG